MTTTQKRGQGCCVEMNGRLTFIQEQIAQFQAIIINELEVNLPAHRAPLDQAHFPERDVGQGRSWLRIGEKP